MRVITFTRHTGYLIHPDKHQQEEETFTLTLEALERRLFTSVPS